jgi:hypothetical protein
MWLKGDHEAAPMAAARYIGKKDIHCKYMVGQDLGITVAASEQLQAVLLAIIFVCRPLLCAEAFNSQRWC